VPKIIKKIKLLKLDNLSSSYGKNWCFYALQCRVFQAADGKNLIIVTDGRTDGRTDRIAMAKTRYSSTCYRA